MVRKAHQIASGLRAASSPHPAPIRRIPSDHAGSGSRAGFGVGADAGLCSVSQSAQPRPLLPALPGKKWVTISMRRNHLKKHSFVAAVGGAPGTRATKTNEDIPALQVRDLKHRATKSLAQGHTHSCGVGNPGPAASDPEASATSQGAMRPVSRRTHGCGWL